MELFLDDCNEIIKGNSFQLHSSVLWVFTHCLSLKLLVLKLYPPLGKSYLEHWDAFVFKEVHHSGIQMTFKAIDMHLLFQCFEWLIQYLWAVKDPSIPNLSLFKAVVLKSSHYIFLSLVSPYLMALSLKLTILIVQVEKLNHM